MDRARMANQPCGVTDLEPRWNRGMNRYRRIMPRVGQAFGGSGGAPTNPSFVNGDAVS